MPKTLDLADFELPRATAEDVRRFDRAARIKDPVAFAAVLDEFLQEKLASATRAVAREERAVYMVDKARALRAPSRWRPSATEIQRGRHALLEAFDRPGNLPLPEFAQLAHKSRQQIYKDLNANPKRLLALSVGPRKQRLPDWQLDPLRLELTRRVLEAAADVDAWTIYRALSEPAENLRRRSPVDAVTTGNVGKVVAAVCDTLSVLE